MTAEEPLLQATNLHTWFELRQWGFLRVGSVRAVDGVDFELAKGESVAFVGESGCGKSSLARTLLGLHNPSHGDVTHVEGRVDPVADAETIEMELMLADMESLEKRMQNIVRKVRGGDKEAVQQERLMKLAMAALEDGKPARVVEVDAEDAKAWKMLQLLTTKPVLYVCNVSEEEAAEGNDHSAAVAEMAAAQGNAHVIISARIEEEISQLEPEEAEEFLGEMGLEEPGLDRLIRAGYELLHLETYFTVGPKEARAWTISKGTLAPQAAGVIHGDFEKGFIRAETIAYEDYVSLGGEQPAKEAGKMRAEGKGYLVKDGDVLHFLFNT